MTDKQDLIREIHEYVTTHGGENTATHLLVQAASAIQTQAAELEAVGAGGVSGPLMGSASLSAQAEGWRLVPVDPTPAMGKAAADAWLDCGSRLVLNKAAAAVAAGIAAAPNPPTSAEGVE